MFTTHQHVGNGELTIDLGDIDALRVEAHIQPHATTLAVVSDAITGLRRGLPEPIRKAAAAQVDPSAGQALAPTIIAVPSPLCLTDFDHGQVQTDDLIDSWLSSDLSTLERDTSPSFVGPTDPRWARIFANPKPWAEDVGRIYRRAAPLATTLTNRAGWLLEREIARIATALVSGATKELLANLTPSVSLVGNQLRRSFPTRVHVETPTRLVLVPTISGPDAIFISAEEGDLVLHYPIRGVGRLLESDDPRDVGTDAVSLVLGDVRAKALRLLDQPITMHKLASALGCAPNTATYHCDKMVQAGLIDRYRIGNSVWLRRTDRGSAMLDLLQH